ncbi:MAG: hypothetical protein LUC38_03560 [Oscillospiraceae bacterium]|nr:hypothetical protein [Oscillospiraceae bacterium]
MKKLIAIVAVVLAFQFRLDKQISNFVVWLCTLSTVESDLSVVGEALVDAVVFFAAYYLVGIIFRSLGFFDKWLMKIAYFVISTLISFALCQAIAHLWITLAIAGTMIAVGLFIHRLNDNNRFTD